MILVDTSVWIEHLQRGKDALGSRLQNAEVLCHPFIIGELACGVIRNRTKILSLLQSLPKAETVSPEEVLQFIVNRKLAGKGLGYVDIHLLASAVLTGVPLWTLEKKLLKIAAALRAAYTDA